MCEVMDDMLRVPFLFVLLFSVAEAFITPYLLSGRANAVYTRGWGVGIDHARRELAFQCFRRRNNGAIVPAHMSFGLGDVATFLADGDVDGSVELPIPISEEVLESAISVLSVASSVLLVVIVAGTIYLTVNEWKTRKEIEDSDAFIKRTGTLPPTDTPKKAPTSSPEEAEDEGNRLYRRMAKKERRKEKN